MTATTAPSGSSSPGWLKGHLDSLWNATGGNIRRSLVSTKNRIADNFAPIAQPWNTAGGDIKNNFSGKLGWAKGLIRTPASLALKTSQSFKEMVLGITGRGGVVESAADVSMRAMRFLTGLVNRNIRNMSDEQLGIRPTGQKK